MHIKKITASVFAVTFTLGLITVNFFNHFYAEKALHKDAEQLLFQFHDAMLEAHDILENLPNPDTFQCSEEDVKKLAMLAFEHPAVRLVGVLHGQEQHCASENVYIDLSNYHQRTLNPDKHVLKDQLSLATVTHGDEHLDLLMVRSHENSRYFASINPFMVNYLTEFACMNCLEYDFVIQGLPNLEFKSKRIKQPSYIEYTASRMESDVKVTLNLRGTKAFYIYYQELSWFSTVAFSFVLATLLALFAFKLLTIRQSMDRIIKDAIKFKEFTPFYQPIIDSRTNQVVGVEMLARWVHKDGAVVPAYQFIPFSEDTGLIVDITEQLIKKMAKDIKTLKWDKSDQFVSINIVPDHFKDNALYELLESLMNQYEIAPSTISLEITERMKIDNLPQARACLDDFYKKGIDLKLDDAGTGYGGFSYIQELGISTLKIDKMFIDTINSDDLKSSVLDAIISFAKSSNLKMIAEGVEHQHQVDYLKKRDVCMIQGYIYAKPMPIAQLQQWLKDRA